MSDYPIGKIAEKADDINKKLRGSRYMLDMEFEDYYKFGVYWNSHGKIRMRLLTGPSPGFFVDEAWVIYFGDLKAGAVDMILQEIVKYDDGWMQRLLNLETELAIGDLPG